MRRTPGFYRSASRIEDQMIRATMPRVAAIDPVTDTPTPEAPIATNTPAYRLVYSV